jgi:hypothetical protein
MRGAEAGVSLVSFMNGLIDLPSPYAAGGWADPDEAEVFFFDHNYVDRRRLASSLDDLERVLRARGLDLAGRTLLLSARGLDPHQGALLDFARRFGEAHVFIELWNVEREVHTLHEARLDNLYFLPVTAALDLHGAARRASLRPNRNVFVSLGGDDDLELLREVVRRHRHLHFYIPDLAWEKVDGGRREFEVRFDGDHVAPVPCNHRGFTFGYRVAYLHCDTVLIATQPRKRHQMRGGIRVADALAARKRLVLAHNSMCELLMAQHERTCLVADHDADALCEALDRAVDGRFVVDEPLYEEIRALTRNEAKLAWMLRAPRAPAEARRSAFFRGRERLSRELEGLTLTCEAGAPVEAAFGLHAGQLIGDGARAARVASIRRLGPSLFQMALARPGAPELLVDVSTVATEMCYRRTRRGHHLSYRGRKVQPADAVLLDALAELL